MLKSATNIYNVSLRTLIDGLLCQLQSKGYSEKSLRNYTNSLRPIQTFMQQNGIAKYTPKVGQKYYEHYLNMHNPGKHTQQELHSRITRLNDYCSGIPFSDMYTIPVLHTIPECFQSSVNEYFEFCFKSGYVEKTIKRKRRNLTKFLSKCHVYGVSSINKLTPQCVLLASKDVSCTDEWQAIRLFLRFSAERGLTLTDLSMFVPTFSIEKKLPTTYSIEEIQSLEAAIDRSTLIGKRDYAMILLADRLGIRSGDIVSLKYENLDFKNEKVSFIQNKTGNEITLTMVSDVKKALNDYIQQESIHADGVIFHKTHAPYGPISNTSVYDAVNKYMKLANINTIGKKHGPHTLRASLSTSMVNDDIPYEAVRNILGHTSKDSIKHYAKTDIDRLRRCAVSVPAPSGNFQKFLQEVIADV